MVKCGLHDWERHPERPNRLQVDVDLFSFGDVPRAVDAANFMDYDRLRNAILAWAHRPHTDLLETLAEDLLTVCLADPLADAARVSVIKPDIFPEANGAGVELFRFKQR